MPVRNYSDEQQWRDVQAARRGDRDALGRVYDHLFPRLYAYVAHHVGVKQDAEDIVAEAWLRTVRKLHQFRGEGAAAFSGWIFQIARRLIADHYRRAAPADPAPYEQLERTPATRLPPQQVMEQEEQQRRVRAVVATLSPRRQEIVVLRYFGGLGNREIAQILGLDERTVASHLSRALRDLHERLVEEV